eukprot:Skav222128  [mRNA]  locus=scaffold1181:673984:690078:- [translate_table: standard]
MDHPWMQMIYKQVFSLKQYATWLALNHAVLAHHFLQYNAVLSGGAYLGKMVSGYLQDFDTLEISEDHRTEMLRVMKRIYAETEAMMSEVFELNPVKGISYKTSQDQAIRCELLDVSSGREMYGPSGGYSLLAGHDVTRCLATMSLEPWCGRSGEEPEHLDDLQWSSDSAEDEEALKNWQQRLKEKYPLAGKLRATSAWAGEEIAAEGLRKRSPVSAAVESATPSTAATAAGEDRCPISGKQGRGLRQGSGTCPMASIMGMAGVKMPEKPEPSAAASSASANGSSSFMKGKSLVPRRRQR